MQNELASNKGLLISTCAGVICSSIVLPFYSIGALVVPITDEFGWTRAEFQLALLFSTGAGVITAPIVGWLTDRYGARNIALPGLIGLSAAFVLAANMNGELWMLYLSYAAMAFLGAGTIPVTWTRAITTNFFRQRGIALGLVLSGTGICGIVVPQYTVWIIEEYGWRAAYLGLAALPILFAGPVIFLYFRPKEGRPDDSREAPDDNWGLTFSQAIRSYRYWVLLVSIFLVYMAMSGITPNLMPALTDRGVSMGEAANAISIFGLAVIVGRLVVGYLVDHLWAPGIAALAIALPVVGSLLLYGDLSYSTAMIAAFLLGFAAGAELDLMSFLAAKYFGLINYAKIYAVLYAALAIASGVAPMLFAYIFDETGNYDLGFLIATGFFAVGALLLLSLGKYPNRQNQ
jgi:predicted MFS family arabinose efflux permease